MRDKTARECVACHASFIPTRSDQQCCNATCRKRKERDTYIVTEEDRAAMRRAAEAVPIPVAPPPPGVKFASLVET